jgi:glyoxylase-like metal-dependent hydrolase (beta-lactamase superfamily II)
MLEDHLGDIVRKARAMCSVSAHAAAKAAGLTLAELSTLEESGQIAKRPDFTALAAMIGLDARKLQEIANGWLPSPKDLGVWRELRQVSTTRGGNAVNCYVVWDEISREAALFDTGWNARPVSDLLVQNRLQLRHVFITHGHEDHVAALDKIRDKFPKALLHSSSKHAPASQQNRSTDSIHLGSLRITNRDTPGHAEDGATYIVGNWSDDAPQVAFVGDAVFAGSIGRGFQSWELARQKIREQIFTLPPATLICPGHGPLTTVAEEKAHNPFFG